MAHLLLIALIFLQTKTPSPADDKYAIADEAYYSDDFKSAAHLYLEAAHLFLSEGNNSGQSKSLNDAGLSYMKLGVLDSALTLFAEAYKIDVKTRDTVIMASRLINIGAVNSNLGRNIDGLEAYLLAAKLGAQYRSTRIEAKAY